MPDLGNLSFRNKLRAAFLAVALLSILITGGFSYSITADILENNALKLTQNTVVKSTQTFDEKLSKLRLIMMTFLISQPLQDMLEDVYRGNNDRYYTHLTNLDNVFSQARIAEPLIDSIYVSTPMGEFYPLTLNRNRSASFFDTPMYRRISTEQRNFWMEGHEDTLFVGKHRVISLVLEPITDSNFPVKDVYVVVNIRENGLHKLIEPQAPGNSVRFLLNDNADLVIADAHPLARQVTASPLTKQLVQNPSSGYESYKLNGEDYLFNYAKLHANGWTIVSIQSKAHVLKDMIYVKWMILSITAASLIITLLVSGAFTYYLLKPLKGLLHVMRRVEGNDLAARFESRSQDELAQVGFRFNRMLAQIVLLIDEVKTAEANKRASEIKALSAQMDPHFLYNTLNTIYWKLKLGQVEASQQMVVSLSRLFQLGLNKGNEITTLGKEIQHVRGYLELQALCYENLFEYHIEVGDPRLLEQPVPRIILQPLAENSILHGFRSLDSGGRIDIAIDGDASAGQWTIEVRDNGSGMNEAEVQALFGQAAGQGYAFANLISRLQLYGGERTSLTVDSKPGRGTTVRIALPMKEAS